VRGGAFQPLLARMSRWVDRLGAPVLLLVLVALAFWRILFTDQYSILNGYDLSSQVLPWLQFQASEWHAGRFPQWSPYEWGGQNLIGQAQPSVVNPLNWIVYLAPLRRGWIRQGVLHWWFYLLHAIAALNLYWLARSLGATRLAAVFGGLVFGLLGFLGSVDWPQMISGIVWAPLCFLFVLRGSRESEWQRQAMQASFAGFFLGLSWLSGHHQLPIFLSLSLLGSMIALRFWNGIVTFAVGGMVGAAQLLPALLYGRGARRWVGMESTVGWEDKVAYYVHERYSNAPGALLGILLPGHDVHTSLFLGMTAMALAGWALYTQWERREVKLFFGLAVAGLFYALGRWGFLEPVLYSFVPMVEKARSPSMAGAIFTFGGAALAALGLDRLMKRGEAARLVKAHWIFGGTVVALFLLGTSTTQNQQRLDHRWLAVALVSLLVGLAYRGKLQPRRLGWVAIGAVMVESGNITYFNLANRHDPGVTNLLPAMAKHQDVYETLRSQPGPVRVTVDDNAIGYNFGDWYGVEVMGGYLASLSANLHDLDIHSERGMRVWGVGYHLGFAPLKQGEKELDAELIYTGKAGVNVYRFPHTVLPRVRLVHRAIGYNDRAGFNELFASEAVDVATTALVRGAGPRLENCEGNEAVSILRRAPGRMVARAEAACRALLIVAETDDAGWSVYVDGKRADKITVYEAQRGVVIEKGAHTVEWTYTAPGLVWGASLSGLGVLLVGLAGWWGSRRASRSA
jgi:hypothetical protein